MLRNRMRQSRLKTRGAALVEYTILLAMLAIAVPAVVILSDDVDELLDGNFGLEPPTGGPVEVAVPGCVSTGQCVPPPGLIEQCVEDYGYFERCGDYPLVPIDSGVGENYVVPILPEDPAMIWAMSDNNEDYDPPVYANNGYDGSGNTALLAGHEIVHVAARYCQSRGMFLPAIEQLEEMSRHTDTLQLQDYYYLSSSQYWYSLGGFYPAPVSIAGNSARIYNMRLDDGEIGIPRIGFVGAKNRVRCAFGVPG